MAGEFFRNTSAGDDASATRSVEAASSRTELQDIYEQLAEGNALLREVLTHIREMTGLDVGEEAP